MPLTFLKSVKDVFKKVRGKGQGLINNKIYCMLRVRSYKTQ